MSPPSAITFACSTAMRVERIHGPDRELMIVIAAFLPVVVVDRQVRDDDVGRVVRDVDHRRAEVIGMIARQLRRSSGELDARLLANPRRRAPRGLPIMTFSR